ncbi:MAG: hypothetical protein ACOY0T_39740 [Myxococcota bacterium]
MTNNPARDVIDVALLVAKSLEAVGAQISLAAVLRALFKVSRAPRTTSTS